jgi:hypothetical protein
MSYATKLLRRLDLFLTNCGGKGSGKPGPCPVGTRVSFKKGHRHAGKTGTVHRIDADNVYHVKLDVPSKVFGSTVLAGKHHLIKH